MITVGKLAIVTKGCAARKVNKGEKWLVRSIEWNEEASALCVVLMREGRIMSWWNRSREAHNAPLEVALHDGNPLHKIKIYC